MRFGFLNKKRITSAWFKEVMQMIQAYTFHQSVLSLKESQTDICLSQ